MIVRNEAHTIAKTLASALAAIDRYCILDTLSTDETPDIIRETLKSIPGEVHQEAFVDFATSRNRVLDLAGQESTFILNMDADDVLVGADRLRQFLTSVRALSDGGYYLKLAVTGSVFPTVRLLRASARWRYVGAVHELLLPPGGSSYPKDIRTLKGVQLDHFPDATGNKKTKERWAKDVAVLRRELERNPEDTRSAFYLARTLADMAGSIEDDPDARRAAYEQAIEAYDVRIKQGGGFKEEIFSAKLYKARAARNAGRRWTLCLQFWLDAHEENPLRSEPLADIAAEYGGRDEHASCVLFARRAFELLPAEGLLFVEDHAYTVAHLLGWHAFYVPGAEELGKAACRRAIELRPEGSEQDKANLALYLARESSKR
jgi:glycosyltransferase involved in cell wall biosynthesis